MNLALCSWLGTLNDYLPDSKRIFFVKRQICDLVFLILCLQSYRNQFASRMYYLICYLYWLSRVETEVILEICVRLSMSMNSKDLKSLKFFNNSLNHFNLQVYGLWWIHQLKPLQGWFASPNLQHFITDFNTITRDFHLTIWSLEDCPIIEARLIRCCFELIKVSYFSKLLDLRQWKFNSVDLTSFDWPDCVFELTLQIDFFNFMISPLPLFNNLGT